VAIDADAMAALLPPFALQTLVENAVRHAAAPRVEPTRIGIRAAMIDGLLVVEVSDDGPGADPVQLDQRSGTGLRRLRERCAWLYGEQASVDVRRPADGGFSVRLRLPQAVPQSSGSHG